MGLAGHARGRGMRGFIHPPVSGEYTFGIASDNSSELGLRADITSPNQKKIASIARFTWVAPRGWTKHASQRSQPIWLAAGRSYYIEAVHEQVSTESTMIPIMMNWLVRRMRLSACGCWSV